MKILLVMDPGILVPPKGYGGHERLLAMFAKEYQQQGHEVHLLVTTGSFIEGCVMHPFGKEGFPPKKSDALKAIPTAWKFLWKHRNNFDLIHNFGRLVYLLPVLNNKVKKIMTYGREISSRNIRLINKLPNKNLVFTGCSANLVSRGGVAGRWETVYNAIEFRKYTLVTKVPADAPLIFLGRIERIKGCHSAIKVARATNNKLIIAGNVSSLADEQQYFQKEIMPMIDGVQIVHVGSVDDESKNRYLGTAKALLFPIEWDEPFGMVMVEAMACGTPVIAINKGSVGEVIREGETGYKVNSIEEMINKVKLAEYLNRTYCRKTAQESFDVGIIAKKYLSLLH